MLKKPLDKSWPSNSVVPQLARWGTTINFPRERGQEEQVSGEENVIRGEVTAEKQTSCSGLPENIQTAAHTEKNPARRMVRMMFQYFWYNNSPCLVWVWGSIKRYTGKPEGWFSLKVSVGQRGKWSSVCLYPVWVAAGKYRQSAIFLKSMMVYAPRGMQEFHNVLVCFHMYCRRQWRLPAKRLHSKHITVPLK